MKLATLSALIFATALALSFYHLTRTAWDSYTNDARQHRDYIEYIVQHNALPEPYAGAAFRHPPGYYLLAAGAYMAGDKIHGEQGAIFAVRLLSLGFYAVFLFYCFLCARLLVATRAAYLFTLVLLSFWPVGMTLGARITCDIALYAASAATLYHLLRWQQRCNARELAAALVFVAAGMLVKNGMFLWLVPIGVLMVIYGASGRLAWRGLVRREVLLALTLVALASLITFARSTIFTNIPSPTLVLEPAQTPMDFFGGFRFDLVHFVGVTIHESIGDPTGFYFFNHLLRSFILDTFLWRSEYMVLGVALLLLSLMAYALPAALIMVWKTSATRRTMGTLCIIGASFLLALMAIYFAMPFPHYASVRYMYIVVPIFGLVCGMVMDWHARQGRGLLAGFGMLLVLLFAICSVFLLIAQHVIMFRLDIAN